MALVRTTVTIPEELLALVDEYAGPRGRSAFVAAAIEQRVKRERLGRVIRETAGVLEGSATWRTPEDVTRWVDELRRTVRDPWADVERRRATELADAPDDPG